MKRLVLVAVVLVGLSVEQVASAHHTVYGSAKRAVLQSLVTKSPRSAWSMTVTTARHWRFPAGRWSSPRTHGLRRTTQARGTMAWGSGLTSPIFNMVTGTTSADGARASA
jgi:hypothetical protein